MNTAPHRVPAPPSAQLGHSRIPVQLAVVFGVAIGALNAVQSRVNGALGTELADGFLAAAISFGSGLAILAVAMAFSPVGRDGMRRLRVALRAGTLPWWALFGGVSGAFYVLSQSFTATLLGVALFTVGIVCGQTVSGLLVDRFGIGPGGRRMLTAPRIVGAALALGAVVWAVSGQLNADVPLWLIWMPLVAGVGQAWQQAVNGTVRVVSHSVLTATFLNFVAGSLALAVVVAVHVIGSGWPATLPAEPWLYAGGAIGCVFVAASALVVRIIGVFVLSLAVVSGQLLCALALDLLAPTGDLAVSPATIAGTALSLVAVTVVGVRWHGIRYGAGRR